MKVDVRLLIVTVLLAVFAGCGRKQQFPQMAFRPDAKLVPGAVRAEQLGVRIGLPAGWQPVAVADSLAVLAPWDSAYSGGKGTWMAYGSLETVPDTTLQRFIDRASEWYGVQVRTETFQKDGLVIVQHGLQRDSTTIYDFLIMEGVPKRMRLSFRFSGGDHTQHARKVEACMAALQSM